MSEQLPLAVDPPPSRGASSGMDVETALRRSVPMADDEWRDMLRRAFTVVDRVVVDGNKSDREKAADQLRLLLRGAVELIDEEITHQQRIARKALERERVAR